MTRPSAPLLDIAGLSIRFGGLAALSDVDLAVGAGEIFALIGPNGAGKTTVFNVLTGLYRPSAGRVRFDGQDLLACAPHAVARLGVARTFQNTEVFRGLSALDNVLIGAHARLRGWVVAAALGRTSPEIARRVVLLPLPLAPSRVTISPAPTVSDTPSSARRLP